MSTEESGKLKQACLHKKFNNMFTTKASFDLESFTKLHTDPKESPTLLQVQVIDIPLNFKTHGLCEEKIFEALGSTE